VLVLLCVICMWGREWSHGTCKDGPKCGQMFFNVWKLNEAG
jgi:hypothetical protein